MREIRDNVGIILGIVDSIDTIPVGLSFYGTENDFIQIASFYYPEGKILRDHMHIEHDCVSRKKCQEILILFEGKLSVRVYDGNKNFIETFNLCPGEYYIVYNGGVGYEVLAEAKMLEIKNGPFPGSEKDRVLV